MAKWTNIVKIEGTKFSTNFNIIALTTSYHNEDRYNTAEDLKEIMIDDIKRFLEDEEDEEKIKELNERMEEIKKCENGVDIADEYNARYLADTEKCKYTTITNKEHLNYDLTTKNTSEDVISEIEKLIEDKQEFEQWELEELILEVMGDYGAGEFFFEELEENKKYKFEKSLEDERFILEIEYCCMTNWADKLYKIAKIELV